jgi:hypothetical protein
LPERASGSGGEREGVGADEVNAEGGPSGAVSAELADEGGEEVEGLRRSRLS